MRVQWGHRLLCVVFVSDRLSAGKDERSIASSLTILNGRQAIYLIEIDELDC